MRLSFCSPDHELIERNVAPGRTGAMRAGDGGPHGVPSQRDNSEVIDRLSPARSTTTVAPSPAAETPTLRSVNVVVGVVITRALSKLTAARSSSVFVAAVEP